MITIRPGEWIAILGGAGSGKTTTANEVSRLFQVPTYSADFRFIGDSTYRKNLLKEKAEKGFDSYRDAVNQASWWDWDNIYNDLLLLKGEEAIHIPVYNRDTGDIEARTFNGGKELIYEGVMLGQSMWTMFSHFYFLYTDPTIRFTRLMEKDKGRRTMSELAARFLICDYSEKMFYKYMFDKLDPLGKMIYIDTDTCERIPRPKMDWPTYVPMEVL